MKSATLLQPGAMLRIIAVPVVAMLMPAAASPALAAPVIYNFSTAAGPLPGLVGPASLLGGAIVSGTFEYDPLAPFTSAVPGGASLYGIQNFSPTFPSSFANLAGSVAGYSFADARGSTVVGNETFVLSDFSTTPPTTTNVDFLQLNTQSATPISGFSIGGYTLANVRMFWIEGQQTPGTIPEFLGNQDLPGQLPLFQGRLALDFVPADNPSGPVSGVFFDGLNVAPVPEPQTYAMLLAGLGLLGFAARRRMMKEAA